jgi:tetratricopeptide (TPR) repeat protein
MKEIAKLGSPDLIIVLSGNNERNPPPEFQENFSQSMEYLTKNYENNIIEVARIAEEYKIPTLILTVPTNIRDWIPSDFDDFNATIVNGLISKGEFNNSLSLLKGDMNNSLRLYYLGRTYDKMGDFENAQKYYIMAKDLDKSFFRARSPWNNIVLNTNQSKYLSIIDAERIMKKYARDGIPGNDMFFDYCHFKLRYNQILAYEISRKVLEDHFPEADTAGLDNVTLESFKPEVLKKLYLMKKIAWYRLKYYSAFARIRDTNTNMVIENYNLEIALINGMIGRLNE